MSVACNPEQGPDTGSDDAQEIYLNLSSSADTLVVLEADFAGTRELALETNLPKKAIKVEKADEQVWCDASLNADGDAIIITPGRATTEEQCAEFVVSGSYQGQSTEPVTFKVVRKAEIVIYTLSISCNSVPMEGDYPQWFMDETGGSVEVEVQTDAEMWYLTYTSYAEEGASDWFSISKSSGGSGEKCVLTVSENDTDVMRNQLLVFSTDAAGLQNAVTLVLMQDVKASDVSAVVIRSFNPSTMTAGEVLQNGYEIMMPNTNTARSPFCFHVETQDGSGIEVKFAEVGSDQVMNYTDWVFFGSKDIENEEYEVVGKYYTISTTPNPGGVRSMDAVVFPRGGKEEIFRFTVIQAGSDSSQY